MPPPAPSGPRVRPQPLTTRPVTADLHNSIYTCRLFLPTTCTTITSGPKSSLHTVQIGVCSVCLSFTNAHSRVLLNPLLAAAESRNPVHSLMVSVRRRCISNMTSLAFASMMPIMYFLPCCRHRYQWLLPSLQPACAVGSKGLYFEHADLRFTNTTMVRIWSLDLPIFFTYR